MIKIKSNITTDELTIRFIKENLLPYNIQLFNNTPKGLRPFASGVLTKIYDKYFIFSASHVADYMAKESNDLFVKVNKKGYLNILGKIKCTDIEKSNGVDLAYIVLDQRLISYLERVYKFLPLEKLAKHNKFLDTSNYCIIGFPEKNIKFANGLMETGASVYITKGTNEKPYRFYNLDQKDTIIVSIEGKGIDLDSNERKKLNTHFYGLSGGGLWELIYLIDSFGQIINLDYRLIGIMTEFRNDKFFCFFANKIHLIIDALKVIERFKFSESEEGWVEFNQES